MGLLKSTDDVVSDVISFTSIEQDLARADIIQDQVQDRRQRIIDKLELMVDSLDEVVPTSKSEAEAKFLPINTLLTALKDHESSARGRATLKLRKQDADRTNDTAEIVAAFMRKPIDECLSQVTPDDLGEITDAVEAAIEADSPILESELKEDPTDLD